MALKKKSPRNRKTKILKRKSVQTVPERCVSDSVDGESSKIVLASSDSAGDARGKSSKKKETSDEPDLPDVLPLLPVNDVVLFPDMVLPLLIHNERDSALIDNVVNGKRLLAVGPMTGETGPDNHIVDAMHTTACAAVVLKMLRFPDNTTRVLVQGLKRLTIQEYVQREPFMVVRIKAHDDRIQKSKRLDALYRSVREQFERMISLLPQFPEEVKVASLNITHPGRFADLVSSNINLSIQERCQILDELDVVNRLETLSVMLAREMEIVELGSKIQADVKEKIAKGQRDFYLREQLQAIRQELGDEDARIEIDDLEKQLKDAHLPDEAYKEAERELKRLARMQPGSSEYTVARTYLDWMITLPWTKVTQDLLDIKRARQILDDDHYDLKKVKDRIIEFLAVRKIYPEGRSPILCLVGPPGVGKTSLGKSVARAMGRKFVRISLGGMRDEAEIRGHRRTYVGALPGRIIQGLRKAGSSNPVFMMDEIDKLQSDFRGDPASALLEVLDPEQNSAFSDYYLEAPFDLSKVIFITTANQLETIPAPLRDRMEVLQIPGYSEEEKLEISRKHLVPRVLSDHGMRPSQAKVPVATLKTIIRDYTREAGLRNLERDIATCVRKMAVKMAAGKKGPFSVTTKELSEYLGPQRYHGEAATRTNSPGVAVGLVWTPVGGDILFIEASRMAGKKTLQLTGHLGDVIKESAHAALSWIRAHSAEIGVSDDFYDNSDIHIHFPEGATPKDGPSAGIALVASLASLLSNRTIKPRLAMTGEITLRGKVLPVGGIKEKMLGARRAGIRNVILPQDNMSDLEELPAEVRKDLTFYPVTEIGEVLKLALNGKVRSIF